jgi:hypothetical protein
MAKSIRRVGLRLFTALVRLIVRDVPAGWQRSDRSPTDLQSR